MSGLPTSHEERRRIIDEWVQSGWIDAESGDRLLDKPSDHP